MIEGEGKKLLVQIREISNDVLHTLMEIDDQLANLQDYIKLNEEVDKESLLKQINEIRLKIGVTEREDTQEIKEEEILENMLQKLNNLIDITL